MRKVEESKQLINVIKNRAHELSAKTVTLGFDGFIDSVVKVIRYKDHQSPVSYL